MSLHDSLEKIKQFLESDQGKDVTIVTIIIFVGFGSFGLGRLSKKEPNQSLKIEYNGLSAGGEVLKDQNQGFGPENGILTQNSFRSTVNNFFASSRGTKYYTLSCSSGKTIKEKNRIYFESGAEAEKAGYVLSSSCR